MKLVIIIHKSNKYKEFELTNPLCYSKKTSKIPLSQITRKIFLIQKKSKFPEVRRINPYFMPHKIKLIICLSSHTI